MKTITRERLLGLALTRGGLKSLAIDVHPDGMILHINGEYTLGAGRPIVPRVWKTWAPLFDLLLEASPQGLPPITVRKVEGSQP